MRYTITSKFGEQEGFRNSSHTGIDLAIPNGTPLYSIQDGTIFKIVDYGNKNIGKGVLVEWEDGKIAIYGHLSKFANIREGQKVSAGDLIGFSGNSGNVVGKNGGYHLHFGLKDGQTFIDPSPYIDLLQNMDNKIYLAQKLNTITPASYDIVEFNLKMFNKSIEYMLTKITFIIIKLIDYAHLSQFFQ